MELYHSQMWLVVTCWERADLLHESLVWDVLLCFCHFPMWWLLGQVWCLIKLIPDLCLLLTFIRLFMCFDRFVQYVATVGGLSGQPGCFKPYSRDQSVILQYSTDGGISWHTLHTLDYTSYLKPRRDYITLPQDSRTSSTRIRWWQPLPEPRSRLQPSWAIDNLFIGK